MKHGNGHSESDPATSALSKSDLELDLELRELGIDDLTKFRIVQYLCQNPGRAAEASSFAAALGFHSLEQTEVALGELGQRGILDQQRTPGQTARYGLAADPLTHRRVIDLMRGTVGSADYEGLLESLARRSLAHARAWASKKDRGDGNHNPPGLRTAQPSLY